MKNALQKTKRTLWTIALLTAVAQNNSAQSKDKNTADPLQQHYSAAQDAQAAGNLKQAEAEYRRFLAQGLRRLSDHRANAGDFHRALSFFEEALRLTPDDNDLRLDYTETCLRAGDRNKAMTAAEQILGADSKNAKAHFLLGRIALQSNDNENAKLHLEAAVHLDPTFEHGYTLANAYLKLRDPDQAAKIFAEMESGFGDTAQVHMEFGRAYAQAGYPERAVPEFKKAIAKDDKFPGAHYSLGAAYLVGLSDAAYPEAAAEFRIELKNHPDDLLSLTQLGSIALSQHNLDEAEKLLRHAAALDPKTPDTFLGLGQVYAEQNRETEAEDAFRKSIELTSDASRNHYQVQRAHYQLGRLLAQTGRAEDAKQELKVADQLLKESVAANQGKETPNRAAADFPPESMTASEIADPETMKTIEAYEKKVSPAFADAYNNLGVIAASNNTLVDATDDFAQARAWNPSLEDIDSNLARAALSARQFDRAIPPLTRLLQQHPDDNWTRSIHCQLAEVYRQTAHTDDAEREAKSCGDAPQKTGMSSDP